ncbi:hypothetical protein Rctr197k_156 [Virus Rctr197k]|nr:hypothetical protein Rctr197k_156 [Virus Rctr197k]
MKLQIDDRSEVEIELPELGVTVMLAGAALIAMARRAHDNRGRKCRGGPATVKVTGKRPEMFQDRYWVYYETATGSGSRSRLTRAQADAKYEQDVASGDYTYVAVRGPKGAQDPDRGWVTLAEHGTPSWFFTSRADVHNPSMQNELKKRK